MLDVASKNDDVWGEEGVIMPTNWIVSYVAPRHDAVWGENEIKGKGYLFYVSNVTGKEEEQATEHMVSEVDRNRPKLPHDIKKEVEYSTEAEKEGEDQKGDE